MRRLIFFGDLLRLPFDPTLPLDQWMFFSKFVIRVVVLMLLGHLLVTAASRFISARRPAYATRYFDAVFVLFPLCAAALTTGICYWRFTNVYRDFAVTPLPFLARIAVTVLVWTVAISTVISIALRRMAPAAELLPVPTGNELAVASGLDPGERRAREFEVPATRPMLPADETDR